MQNENDIKFSSHYTLKPIIYSKIYPNKKISEKIIYELISHIHIDELMEILIMLLSNKDFLIKIGLNKSIEYYFKNNEKAFTNQKSTKIKKIVKDVEENCLVNPIAIYNLLEFSIINSENFNIKKNNPLNVILNTTLDLILIFNEYYLINLKNKEAKYSDTDVDKIKLIFVKSIDSYDITDINIGQALIAGIIKNVELIKYLNNSTYKLYSNEYTKTLNYENLNDFFKDFGGIIQILNRGNINTLQQINYLQDGDLSITFFEKYCINCVDIKSESSDFLNLRKYPLYNFNNKSIAIISEYFTIEKFYKSLIFDLNEWIKKQDIKSQLMSDLKKDVDEYFLDYCLKNILKLNSYNEEDLKLRSYSKQGLPDYLYYDNEYCIIFESKSVDLDKSSKTSLDFEEIYKSLFIKEGRYGKANDQLLKNIDKIKNNKLLKDNNISAKKFIPIIVTHSRIYDCLGFNYWVNQNFEIKKQTFSFDQEIEISCPIVINIETLLVFRDNFNKDQFIKTLLEYLTYVNNFKASTGTNFLISFDNFINNYFERKNIIPKWEHALNKYNELYIDK